MNRIYKSILGILLAFFVTCHMNAAKILIQNPEASGFDLGGFSLNVSVNSITDPFLQDSSIKGLFKETGVYFASVAKKFLNPRLFLKRLFFALIVGGIICCCPGGLLAIGHLPWYMKMITFFGNNSGAYLLTSIIPGLSAFLSKAPGLGFLKGWPKDGFSSVNSLVNQFCGIQGLVKKLLEYLLKENIMQKFSGIVGWGSSLVGTMFITPVALNIVERITNRVFDEVFAA